MLRLLAVQLERNAMPALRAGDAQAQAAEVAEHVISLANSAADDLEQWVRDFSSQCEQIAAQGSRLEQARRNLLHL